MPPSDRNQGPGTGDTPSPPSHLSFNQLIKTDLKAVLTAHGRQSGLKGLVWALFASDAYMILLFFRLRKLAVRYHVPLVNRCLRGLTLALYGLELGIDVELGSGVLFIHATGSVVGGASIVGDDCQLMGNNTIGTAKNNGHPRIGKGVIIGAGARVLGPIKIGDGAVIGANAVVINDVPKSATVGGIPARVLGGPTYPG